MLVHAIILAPDDYADLAAGERSVHAWVEEGDLCWDAGILDGQHIRFSVEHAEYYAHYRVQETTRYTMADVLRENRRSGHYGPWRPEYQQLVRQPSARRESRERETHTRTPEAQRNSRTP